MSNLPKDEREATGGTPVPTSPKRRGIALHTQIAIGLLLGASLGLAAHYWFSRPAKIPPADQITVDNKLIDRHDTDGDKLDDRLEWTVANVIEPVGNIFLRLMFMVVLPLVVSALALAVFNMGDLRRLGRVGLRTLLYTGAFSMTAVFIGVFLVSTFQPGKSLPQEQRERLKKDFAKSAEEKKEHASKAKSVSETLLDIIPKNPLQEMVGAIDGSSKGGGMLAVMFFALALGVAMTTVPESCATLVALLEGLYAVSMKVIGFAMRLAPLGAACLVFSVAAQLGVEILITLFWFVIMTISGLAFHMLVVYSLVVWIFARMRPWRFFADVSEAMLVAFGSASSSATLPTALRVAEERLRLKPEISRFVLTVGATGNQNGTALYEGVVVLFLAQVALPHELTMPQQIQVVLMSVLAGIGTAGVPGGSLPLIVVLMQSVGIKGEYIAIILGVDRILDMCRTVVNVTGDLAVAACVARGESPTPPDTLNVAAASP